MSILEANRAIQDSHPDFEMYASGGRFIMRDYTKTELLTMLHLIQNRAPGSVYTAITFYGLGVLFLIFQVKKPPFTIGMLGSFLGFNQYLRIRVIKNRIMLS